MVDFCRFVASEVELHLLVHHFRDDTGGAILDEFAWLQQGFLVKLKAEILMRHAIELWNIARWIGNGSM